MPNPNVVGDDHESDSLALFSFPFFLGLFPIPLLNPFFKEINEHVGAFCFFIYLFLMSWFLFTRLLGEVMR